MEEVLTRRFTRGLEEQEEAESCGGFCQFPDLIMMDGGRGQVNIALEVLDRLKLSIPVCGMVKAVSYTHLDVYKRQIPFHAVRPHPGAYQSV